MSINEKFNKSRQKYKLKIHKLKYKIKNRTEEIMDKDKLITNLNEQLSLREKLNDTMNRLRSLQDDEAVLREYANRRKRKEILSYTNLSIRKFRRTTLFVCKSKWSRN